MFFLHVLKQYQAKSLLLTLYLTARYYTAPFIAFEAYLPKKGRFLDIGCGVGLFDLILGIKSASREIIGTDPDLNKILAAQKIKGYPNLKFKHGHFETQKHPKKYDVIIISDVFYVLELPVKVRMLKEAKRLLKPNGLLAVKTVLKEKTLGYYLGYLQEVIFVVLTKKTHSASQELFFSTITEDTNLFKQTGYSLIQSVRLPTTSYHHHHLYLLSPALR